MSRVLASSFHQGTLGWYNDEMIGAGSDANGEPAGPAVVPFRAADGRSRRMILRLDPRSHIPPYEQIRAQISVMVAVGHLVPGTRLPTVRDLAGSLDLAPGTIARTYRELERDGIVEGRGRRGTFVVDEPPESEPVLERRRRLEEAATTFAFAARQLGVPADTAVESVQAAFDSLAEREAT
jgi:DNA-binding transcriptional regulator YhcF (GntR family)